jgi:hypothetical protein
MNLNKRIETLEKKSLLGNGVTVIRLEKGETNDQAKKRYCAESRIDAERLERPDSLNIFLRTDFGD